MGSYLELPLEEDDRHDGGINPSWPSSEELTKLEQCPSVETESTVSSLPSSEEPQEMEAIHTKRTIFWGWFGQAFAAIVVIIAASSSNNLAGSYQGRYLAVIVATFTLLFILLGCTINLTKCGDWVWFQSTRAGGITISKAIAFAMVCWWFAWTCVFTFFNPFGPAKTVKVPSWAESNYQYYVGRLQERWVYHHHWDGYYASWGGVICATLTLMSETRLCSQEDQAKKLVPFILLAAVVQFFADCQQLATHHRYRGRIWYCLILSIFTIGVLSLMIFFGRHRMKSSWKIAVWLLAILWTVLTMLVATAGPFVEEGMNGFWSAWCGCLLFLYWVSLLLKKMWCTIAWEVEV